MTMFGSSIDFLTQKAKDITQTNRKSIDRIASGGDSQKLAAMDRKSGTLGRVVRISADNMSKQDSIRFFQNAISFMKFQEEAISYARNLYSQMHALAKEAQSNSISDSERDILAGKFKDLQALADDLNEIKFNGINLFDELAGSITYDIDFASGLFRSTGGPFETWVNTQDVVYDKGILILDVNTGNSGEHFVFGYVDEIPVDGDGKPISKLTNSDPEKPLDGINPIFDSSTNVNFSLNNNANGTWKTNDRADTSDFDRFFIEWGPDRETSFRFIPLSEGMEERGYIAKRPENPPNPDDKYDLQTIDDLIFANRTKYLENLGFEPFSDSPNLWGLDAYEDSSFGENYSYLTDQNPVPDGSRKAIFDPNNKATREFKESQSPIGDVGVYASDPNNTIMQLRVNSKTIYQVRAQYFKPLTKDTDVGNVGDLNTSMKPIGLGMLRRSSEEEMQQWKNGDIESYSGDNGEFPTLKIDDATEAKLTAMALENEMTGLDEQMGILGNNMARVLTSMEAVDKQLGIQRDLIAAEPEKVVLQELENLSQAREMRSFNASLMNKVVQMNHDMVKLLLM
jgi:flagellin-like hook-associated protein FlgL